MGNAQRIVTLESRNATWMSGGVTHFWFQTLKIYWEQGYGMIFAASQRFIIASRNQLQFIQDTCAMRPKITETSSNIVYSVFLQHVSNIPSINHYVWHIRKLLPRLFAFSIFEKMIVESELFHHRSDDDTSTTISWILILLLAH